MKKEYDNTDVAGICVRVFGAITASVTHEIKNMISIINENAGLLEDLCLMSDDNNVPAEHVDTAAKTQMRQVGKSNTIMTHLNQFAHSGDKIPNQGDLHDILSLVAALTGRFAAMRKISVQVSCPTGIKVLTNLLVFNSLMFVTLNLIFSVSPEGCGLEIKGESDAKRQVIVRFIPEDKSVFDNFSCPGSEEKILADEIDASCRVRDGELVIELAVHQR